MLKLLKFSFIFNLYQHLVGTNGYLKMYADKFINSNIQDNTVVSLLDIGCGSGNMIPFLNKNINYTGIDYEQDYINYAVKKYPNCKFLCNSVTDNIKLDEKFDFVVAEAILTNLDDSKAECLLNIIKNYAKDNCRIIISDTNYGKNPTKFEQFLYDNEVGKSMRTKEQLTALISKHFKINNITEVDRAYKLIPYKKIIFECSPIL